MIEQMSDLVDRINAVSMYGEFHAAWQELTVQGKTAEECAHKIAQLDPKWMVQAIKRQPGHILIRMVSYQMSP